MFFTKCRHLFTEIPVPTSLQTAHARALHGHEPRPGAFDLRYLWSPKQTSSCCTGAYEFPQTNSLQEQGLPVLHLQEDLSVQKGISRPYGYTL